METSSALGTYDWTRQSHAWLSADSYLPHNTESEFTAAGSAPLYACMYLCVRGAVVVVIVSINKGGGCGVEDYWVNIIQLQLDYCTLS